MQQRIEDAGFVHVVATPMGGDRVFLHCNDRRDIWQVFNDAVHLYCQTEPVQPLNRPEPV